MRLGVCLTTSPSCPKTESYSLFTILELIFCFSPTGLPPDIRLLWTLPTYLNLNMVSVVRSVRSSRSRCLTTPHLVCRMKVGPDNPEQCIARHFDIDSLTPVMLRSLHLGFQEA
jgi:hypothetical protein